MILIDIFTAVFCTIGVFFFFAGSLGLVRFKDLFSRLHALTKADNVGLGFIMVGLLPQSTSVLDAIQLVLIWLLVMLASAAGSFLIAKQQLIENPELLSQLSTLENSPEPVSKSLNSDVSINQPKVKG